MITELSIVYMKTLQEKIAVLVPFDKYIKKNKRKLGMLEKRASFHMKKDFEISDEEFLDS